MAAVFDSEYFSLYLAGQFSTFFEPCWVYHSRMDTCGNSETNVQPRTSGIITNNRPLGGPQTVEVTGNFDDWSRSLKALKLDSGQFTATVKVPKRQKLVFKFVIDDADWEVSGDYKIERDENGIENNYLDASELVEDTESVTSSSSKTTPVSKSGIDDTEKLTQTSSKTTPLSKSGTDGAEGLTQTSTTESSFAAVSSSATVPESYEEVQSQESPALVEHDDMGVSMDTPTNSLDNSALLQNTTTNSKNSATKVQDHGKFPIPGDSQVLDSEHHSVDQFRVPGSFPSTPPRGGSTRSQESSSVKKEGFMSKLKSMFR